jgi:16S rRNA processing protein RimM
MDNPRPVVNQQRKQKKNNNIMYPATEFYVVGIVVGCFGVAGYLRVKPASHTPTRLNKLEEVFIGSTSLDVQQAKVQDVIERKDHFFFKLDIVNDRTAAEKAIGNFLFVTQQVLVPPSPHAYFVHDVIGCKVVDVEGKSLGTIEDVYKLPAQDVWVIADKKAKHLLPAVREFVLEVNIKRKRIVVRTIEGLFDEEV